MKPPIKNALHDGDLIWAIQVDIICPTDSRGEGENVVILLISECNNLGDTGRIWMCVLVVLIQIGPVYAH